jgi:hypothetical protein
MSYTNPIMAELMAPRDEAVAERLTGFYNEIGWNVRTDTESEFDIYASPDVGAFPEPTVSYWQTTDEEKLRHFMPMNDSRYSPYARGLRLPMLMNLVEVALVVPSDGHVHDIFEAGGSLLLKHATVPPREHNGVQEFRFADPLNYELRVTADPGYQVNVSDEPNVGKVLLHASGIPYRIDDVVRHMDGYEWGEQPAREVIYTQLADGTFPAGTRYARSEAEILDGMAIYEGKAVPIFRFRDDDVELG